MNNLYRKIAVTSVGIALSFALGANKEAKAATITLKSVTSFAYERNGDGWSYYSGSPLVISDSQAFYEFNIANLSLDPNTIISAVFQVKVQAFDAFHRQAAVQYYSYIADGQAGLSQSDVQTIISHNYSNLGYRGFPAPNPIIENFGTSVTGFVKDRVSNRDAFTGFIMLYPEPALGAATDSSGYLHLNSLGFKLLSLSCFRLGFLRFFLKNLNTWL
jgi:hypothetical protein